MRHIFVVCVHNYSNISIKSYDQLTITVQHITTKKVHLNAEKQ